jgi:DNA polymerase-1
MEKRPRLYVIDGSGYIFRAYYAIRPLSTKAGVPTHAVIGFARMLAKLIRTEQPSYVAVAFDSKEPTFRHALYSEYKANRQAPPEDLIPQFPLVRALVEAMNITCLAQPGFEADDLIASAAEQAVQQGFDAVVVSADKDLLQLVNSHITVLDPMKDIRYTSAEVLEKWGVLPNHITDVQALAGDSSDNIPGVPKVGLKTAASLVQTYGDLENVIKGLSAKENRKATEESVVVHAEDARLSKKLATLQKDMALISPFHTWKHRAPHAQTLGSFLHTLEATSLMKDLLGEDAAESLAPPTINRNAYRTVTTQEAFDNLIQKIKKAPAFSVDLETTSLTATQACVVGVSVCIQAGDAVYIPLRHRYLGMPKQLDAREVLQTFKPLLENPHIQKMGHNIKYDALVLRQEGIHLQGIADDSMLAAYALDASRVSYSMDRLSQDFLDHTTITYDEVTGTGKNRIPFEQVPLEQATAYAAEDADVTWRLCTLLKKKVHEQQQNHLYENIEMPLVPVLIDMEHEGILLNTELLSEVSKNLHQRLKILEEKAQQASGEHINLASPKQLATLMFEKLGYEPVRKTKTGYSTDQEVLEILSEKHDFAKIVLEHRTVSKLLSTYVDALPKMLHPHTRRLHTSFNQTGTSTGRLSSSDPNLQNIPIRTEDGKRIREAFVAAPGCSLICADYSQIELRVLAHMSEDAALIDAFKKGEDIHRRTAMEVLTQGQEPSEEMRRRAKAINFGIVYGQSEFGLSKQLGISRHEAAHYIQMYFTRYPGIQAFFQHTIARAQKEGFVSTLAGRKRYLADINSANRNVQQAAERIAMNTPIQGSAADIIKIAMVRIHKALQEQQSPAKLLLQVHDELVLECPDEHVPKTLATVQQCMQEAWPMLVPLDVSIEHGKHWNL